MPTTIVGRDAELVSIGRFLDRIGDGPCALLISGEPGIGKTTLWRAAAESARSRGAAVLETRPLQADARRAFSAVADLLVDIDEAVIRALPEPQQFALAVACHRADPGRRRLDQRAVAASVVGVLSRMAVDRDVVVAIDDVQWLDQSSRNVLESAARRLRSARVAFIVAQRTEFGHPAIPPLGFPGSIDSTRFALLPVGGVKTDVLGAIISQGLGVRLSDRVLGRIDHASGGNPFFAIEIARTAADAASPETVMRMPRSLIDLVSDRVVGLPDRTREVLLAASSLTRPTRDMVLSAAGGKSRERERALELAEEAAVVTVDGIVRFAHPLIASAVYASASPPERRRMHRRLADLVEEQEERARHLAAASAGPDEDVARVLAAAADSARDRGAPDAAADLAELACASTPHEERTSLYDRTLQAADHHFHAGDVARARTLLERILEHDLPARTRATALRSLADVRLQENSIADALRLYGEALDKARGDLRLEAQIELGSTYACVSSGDFAGIVPHSQRALALAEEVGEGRLIADALAVATIVRFLTGGGLDDRALDRALELEDPDRGGAPQLRPSFIAGVLYLYVGRLDEGRRKLLQVRSLIRERGEETDLPFLLANLGWLETMAGRLDAAEGYVGEARALSETETNTSVAQGYSTLVYGWQGERTKCEAAAVATEAAVEATGWRIALLWSRWGQAELELADSSPQRAAAIIDDLARLVETVGVPEPARFPFLPVAIEALIETRQSARAEMLLEMLEDAAIRLDRGWARIAASRLRAAGSGVNRDYASASAHLAAALTHPEVARFPLEHAKALLTRGRVERAQRRRREADATFQAAEAIFARSGAQGWARHAAAERRRLGLHRSHSELTPSEMRIAAFAASGMTNGAVAERLAISPKTVEASLSRVYTKLGIHSRAELGARRAEFDDQPSPTSR